jgi:hypothetical protein
MTTENTGAAGGADDLDLFESEASGQPVQKVTSETIPAKYAGKTVEDLITMHQNAERLASRQGAELGQIRRLADELIELKKPTTQTTVERKPVTVDALLNDPQKALNEAIDNSPLAARAKAAEDRASRLEAQLAETQFSGTHKPETVARDVNDPAFLEWVNKNPLRQALAAESAKKNFVAAKNLWDLWDEHQELVGQRQTQTQQNPAQGAARKVPNTVKSAPRETLNQAKPNWSRAKLMELRMKVQAGDPAAVARWNDPGFTARMNEAYAEQRVV